MSSNAGTPDTPDTADLVAILVVTDGASWLPHALDALQRQDAELTIVAVDNASTDATPGLLAEAVADEHRVHLSERVGFGRAVAAAIAQTAAGRADRLLLVHEDLLLAPDAASALSAALDADPHLGIVGCKLRGWSDEPVLVEYGLAVDAFGRVESTLEAGEMDQGQRDDQREMFAVSTAGMMVRRRVLADVGGFDARYQLFRDDLDLCWRARVAGWRVEVVPEAVGYHLGAASGGFRELGRPERARELAERHTVATSLKNYRLARVLGLLPLAVALGGAKILAFVALRRFAEAGAVSRAYAWNLVQLPLTLRRRRRVQSRRRVADKQVTALFVPGLPRLRTYGDAVASWVAGGTTRALPDETDSDASMDDVAGWRAWGRWALEHPAAPVGALLLVAYLVGVGGLLGPGALRGETLAPWPGSVAAFFGAAFQPLESSALATGTIGSPAPALLGVVSAASLGSAWLASRLLLLGALPLAWLTALRAGRLLTTRSTPRVVGATVYTLSPAVVGPLAAGSVGLLVTAALLPAVLSLTVRLVDTSAAASPPVVWRTGALLAVALAALGSLAPSALPVIAVVVALGAAVGGAGGERRRGLKRLAAAVAAGVVPLAPWLVGLAMAGWSQAVPAGAAQPMAWWQALTAAPAGAPLVSGMAGVVTAAGLAAVVLAAMATGLRRRPDVVATLALLAVAAGGVAWLLAEQGVQAASPEALLITAALAYGALALLAVRLAGERLGAHAFGVRQVGLVLVGVVVLAGLVTGVGRLGGDGAAGVTRGADPIPAFVRGDLDTVGPYRVLLIDGGPDGDLRWELINASGPTMAHYGATPDAQLVESVDAAVGALGGGVDPRGGGLLGAANVRYLVAGDLPAGASAAFDRQPDLEPMPANDFVWQVGSWLPRVVVRPPQAAAAARAGDPGDTADAATAGLVRHEAGRWVGGTVPADGGALLVAESDPGRWSAVGDGQALEPVDAAVGAAFDVPAGTQDVAASYDAPLTSWLSPALLLAMLAGSVWLIVRPPGVDRRRGDAGVAAAVAPIPPTVITSGRPRLTTEGLPEEAPEDVPDGGGPGRWPDDLDAEPTPRELDELDAAPAWDAPTWDEEDWREPDRGDRGDRPDEPTGPASREPRR